jgi:hypothetical protein
MLSRFESSRSDCFSGEVHFINIQIARDGFAWRCAQYDKPDEFTAVGSDACESATKGDPTYQRAHQNRPFMGALNG